MIMSIWPARYVVENRHVHYFDGMTRIHLGGRPLRYGGYVAGSVPRRRYFLVDKLETSFGVEFGGVNVIEYRRIFACRDEPHPLSDNGMYREAVQNLICPRSSLGEILNLTAY